MLENVRPCSESKWKHEQAELIQGQWVDALEKLQYEFFYLRRQGIALDLRIVGRTIRSVIGRQGR